MGRDYLALNNMARLSDAKKYGTIIRRKIKRREYPAQNNPALNITARLSGAK
jgi:hypothetical protein